MADSPVAPTHSLSSILTLVRSRTLLRSGPARFLAVSVAVVYAFLSLLAGQMLAFFPTQQSGVSVSVVTESGQPDWWNFPGLLVLAPGGVLELPFLPTLTMVLVSAGVGLGMTVGIVLAYRLLRLQRAAGGAGSFASSAAGLTPAMLALVTLGACCSTTAAATAGIGAVAEASGQSLSTVFLNSWYLGFFQLAVLAVALVAQEQLVIIYGGLTGEVPPPASALTARRAGVALLRVGLAAGGVAWILAGMIELAAPPSGAVLPVVVADVLLAHFAVGGAALAAGLFLPALLATAGRPTAASAALRAAIGAGSIVTLLGTPPPLAGWGATGVVNELLGSMKLIGGVAPPVAGLALALRWSVEMTLPAAFALALSVRPSALRVPLLGAGPAADAAALDPAAAVAPADSGSPT